MQCQPTVPMGKKLYYIYYTCGEGENAVSAYCVHGQKTLYIIPAAIVRINAIPACCMFMPPPPPPPPKQKQKNSILYLWRRWERMQYQPTVCIYYTCGEGETAVSADYVSMDKKKTIYIYHTCGDGETAVPAYRNVAKEVRWWRLTAVTGRDQVILTTAEWGSKLDDLSLDRHTGQ